MEGLDIKVVESEKDFWILSDCEYLEKLVKSKKKDKYFAVAAVAGELVGLWSGSVGCKFIPKNIYAKDPCFYSDIILVADRNGFRNKGIGTEIKKHQLEFARSIGCKSLYCEVLNRKNLPSIKIQRKLGARERDMGSEGYQFCFDLEKINL